MRMFHVLVILLLSAPALPGQAQTGPLDLKGKSLPQTFNELLPNLDGKDAQQTWQNLCFQLSAPGRESQRGEACKLMAAKLGPDTSRATRLWLLTQLERIGGAESVDGLASAADDADALVRASAVRALANNPAPQASEALTSRLAKAKDTAKVGILNALGQRADPRSVPAVSAELAGTDRASSVAAARALGRIATPEAAQALAAARGKAEGPVRLEIGDAYLRCADRLLAQKQTAAAAAIYQELNQPNEPRAIRLAALQGQLRSAGDQAGNQIVAILNGKDDDQRNIAIGQIENLSAAALKPLANRLDQLPAASQVLVLTAIANRGDRALLPTALAAARSADPAVQRAGIAALGRLGDASVVSPLIEHLLGGGSAAGPAADSLTQLTADGVNEKLVAALGSEKAAARYRADPHLGAPPRQRGSPRLVAIRPERRRRGAPGRLRRLEKPGGAQACPGHDLGDREDSTGRRADTGRAGHCRGLRTNRRCRSAGRAGAGVPQGRGQGSARFLLLPLLGRLGGADALRQVKDALASSDPALHAAGVAALCNWPEPSVSEDLLGLLQSEKDAPRRLQALQALIRVNTTQPADRPNDAKLASLAALKKAMELSTDAADRRRVLDGIGFIRIVETYQYVLPFLDNAELQSSACRAVVELAHSRTLREPRQAEFNKVLERVIALSKDKALIERARSYKQP